MLSQATQLPHPLTASLLMTAVDLELIQCTLESLVRYSGSKLNIA